MGLMQSLEYSLFKDRTYFCSDALLVSSGNNTLSSAWNKVFWPWRRLRLYEVPWDKTKNSSIRQCRT